MAAAEADAQQNAETMDEDEGAMGGPTMINQLEVRVVCVPPAIARCIFVCDMQARCLASPDPS